MNLNENIENLAKNALSNESHFLVDVVVSSKQGPQKVTVVLDGDQGVTIDDCAALSRTLIAALEEQGAIGDNFTLEVTTPGVDHPLKMKRQYNKNIGRTVKVQLKDNTSEVGKLIAVGADSIQVEHANKDGKKKEMTISTFPFSEIIRTIVQVSFK